MLFGLDMAYRKMSNIDYTVPLALSCHSRFHICFSIAIVFEFLSFILQKQSQLRLFLQWRGEDILKISLILLPFSSFPILQTG